MNDRIPHIPNYWNTLKEFEDDIIKKMAEDYDEWDIPAKVIGTVKGKMEMIERDSVTFEEIPKPKD